MQQQTELFEEQRNTLQITEDLFLHIKCIVPPVVMVVAAIIAFSNSVLLLNEVFNPETV